MMTNRKRAALGLTLLMASGCESVLGWQGEYTEGTPPVDSGSVDADAGETGSAGQGGSDGSTDAGKVDADSGKTDADASIDGKLDADSGDFDAADTADAGGDSGIGELGGPCNPPSSACAGNAQKVVLYCDPQSKKWLLAPSCSGQQLCDTSSGPNQGSCQDPVAVCAGKKPGDKVCEIKKLHTCGPDLVTSTAEACNFVCANGACDGECSPGDKSCDALIPKTCSSLGKWQVDTACAYLCKDGVCSGECTPAQKQCAGNQVQTCSAEAKWVNDQSCPAVCVSGACAGQCTPGTKQCNAKIPRLCASDGSWSDLTACQYVCEDGVCTGSCVPGDKHCSGTKVQTCDATGTWTDSKTCEFICQNATCTGDCIPNAKKCLGLTPWVCDQGSWRSDPDCPYVCGAGVCSGTCVPGARICSGKTPRICNVAGAWEDQTACQFVCSAGVCGGACTPDSVQCNGTALQTCTALGEWNAGKTCPFVCTNAACSGQCTPTSKRCDPNTPLLAQTCGSDGMWSPAANSCPYLCTNGTCTGSCVPNKDTCPDLKTFQSCNAQGVPTTMACPNVCLNGACTGVCSPSTTQCATSTTYQTCTNLGQWSTPATSCTFACINGSCGGVCTPGAKQCSATGVSQICSLAGQWTDYKDCNALGASCKSGECTKCSGKLVQTYANNLWATKSTCPFTCDLDIAGFCPAAKDLAAGGNTSCLLLDNGQIMCWGKNVDGLYGNGTTASSSFPVLGAKIPGAEQFVLGTNFACVRLASGFVKCWGNNTMGQLGVGTSGASSSITSPPAAGILGTSKFLAPGSGSAVCSLQTDGTVSCWGFALDGQNWDGTAFFTSPKPVSFPTLPSATSLYVGGNHACAMTGGSNLYCWGGDQVGQLGASPTVTNSAIPLIASGTSTALSQGGGGDFFSCGFGILNGDSKAYCWGGGGTPVGDGSTTGTDHHVPVDITATLLSVKGSVVSIDPGFRHVCALVSDASGTVVVPKCWGQNTHYQVGLQATGGTGSPTLTPVEVTLPGAIQIPSAQMAVGLEHNCVLTATRKSVRCWGAGSSGQLGNNTLSDSANPGEVLFP